MTFNAVNWTLKLVSIVKSKIKDRNSNNSSVSKQLTGLMLVLRFSSKVSIAEAFALQSLEYFKASNCFSVSTPKWRELIEEGFVLLLLLPVFSMLLTYETCSKRSVLSWKIESKLLFFGLSDKLVLIPKTLVLLVVNAWFIEYGPRLEYPFGYPFEVLPF